MATHVGIRVDTVGGAHVAEPVAVIVDVNVSAIADADVNRM